MNWIKALSTALAFLYRKHFFAFFWFLFAFFLGTLLSYRANPDFSDTFFSLGLLVLIASYRALRTLSHQPRLPSGSWDKRLAWGLLSIALILMFAGIWNHSLFLKNGALFLLSAAVICWCDNRKTAQWMLFPLFLLLIVGPFQENIMLFCSYPLRLLSTYFAVGFWRIFGFQLSSFNTSIYLGTSEIAITDACSGITQFWALCLFGYLMINSFHTNPIWRLLHYLFLLPMIIISNAFRLVATIGLFYAIGNRAFGEFYHTVLGYLLIFLAIILLWAGQFLFPPKEKKNGEDENEK